MSTCPFCKSDPFHYVDNGVGMEAVAVVCCDLAIYGGKTARQTLDNMRSHSPRRKAIAMKVLREHDLRKPSRAERRADRVRGQSEVA
jgi:hypothetical protein